MTVDAMILAASIAVEATILAALGFVTSSLSARSKATATVWRADALFSAVGMVVITATAGITSAASAYVLEQIIFDKSSVK